ncbi:MAG: endonuclease/exonuclease/phosphatase family protein [Deltaproteobacteria bacterium]|jgi:endonuclease/exonuclease/phosphatase family metal-dependent hydrolase|nr:endonuclease/exonuclease/phosphatase family protein [Deltaproteobacteria bacterium]
MLLLAGCGAEPIDEVTAASTTSSTGADTGAGGGGGASETPDPGGAGGQGEGGDGGSTSAPTSLRIMTLNLSNGYVNGSDLDHRTQMVIDAVHDLQPDAIALQEVVQSSGIPNRAAVISQATGYQWEWERSYGIPFLYDEGISLLSRWPIAWRDFAVLPHPDLAGQITRLVLGAGVATPQGVVSVFATHLNVGTDPVKRADQALAAWQYARSVPSELPGFFAGDLNAEPEGLSMRFLRGEASHQGEAGDLVDAWPAANPGDPGHTIPSDDPTRRIDYIYVVPGTGPAPAVDACQLVLDGEDQGVRASDHIGVVCDFTLASTP